MACGCRWCALTQSFMSHMFRKTATTLKAPGTIPEPENQVDLVSLSDNRGQPKEHKQNLAEDYPPANNKQVGQPLTANPVMQKEQIPFSSIKSQVVSTPSSVNSHSKSSNDLESKKTENLTAVSLDEWRDAKIKCMYIGTFDATSTIQSSDHLKDLLLYMESQTHAAIPMYLFVCLEGIKVVSADDGCIEMVHVLQNITKCSVIRGHSIFGFVARDPIKCQREFCHVFQMAEEIHARRTHAILSHAFHLMSRLYNEGIQHADEQQETWAAYNPVTGTFECKDQRVANFHEEDRQQTERLNSLNTYTEHEFNEDAELSLQWQARNARYSCAVDLTPNEITDLEEEVDNNKTTDEFLKHASWYQPGLSREIVEELLENSRDGAFYVRNSQSHPGHFSLTMKAGGSLYNYIITHSEESLRFCDILMDPIVAMTFFSSFLVDIIDRHFLEFSLDAWFNFGQSSVMDESISRPCRTYSFSCNASGPFTPYTGYLSKQHLSFSSPKSHQQTDQLGRDGERSHTAGNIIPEQRAHRDTVAVENFKTVTLPSRVVPGGGGESLINEFRSWLAKSLPVP
eukprot:gene7300-499_t